MANVRKCDVCGGIYELYPDEDVIYIQLNKSIGEYVMIDCCPACTRKLLDFINVIRDYPDNYCVTVHEDLFVD